MIIPIHVEPFFREPSLEDMLSDSIVKAVMQADSVAPEELRALLSSIAHQRGVPRPNGPISSEHPADPFRIPNCLDTMPRP